MTNASRVQRTLSSASKQSVELASPGGNRARRAGRAASLAILIFAIASLAHTAFAEETFPSVDQGPPDFQLTLYPDRVNVSVGGTDQTTAIVAAVNGYAGPDVAISLQAPPSNLTAACDPPSIPPTAACTLIVFAGNSIVPGRYNLTVQASNGTAVRTAILNVTVTPTAPPGDFTISGPQSPVSVPVGKSGAAQVNLSFQGSFSGTVLFSASGVPDGVGYRFDPVSLDASGTVTLTFTVSVSAAAGTYSVLVRGISGSIQRAISVTLKVLPAEYSLVLTTVPEGLQVEVDGRLVTTPYTLTCSAGTNHTISAPGPQSLGSASYSFSSWSDGFAGTHQITCTAAGTLVAVYTPPAALVGVGVPTVAGIAFAAIAAGWFLGWGLLRRRRAPAAPLAVPAPSAPVERPPPPPRVAPSEKLALLEQRKARGSVSEPLYRELKEKFESEGKTEVRT